MLHMVKQSISGLEFESVGGQAGHQFLEPQMTLEPRRENSEASDSQQEEGPRGPENSEAADSQQDESEYESDDDLYGGAEEEDSEDSQAVQLPPGWGDAGDGLWHVQRVDAAATFPFASSQEWDPDEDITSATVAAAPTGGLHALTTDLSGKAVLWDLTEGRLKVRRFWHAHTTCGITSAALMISAAFPSNLWRALTVGEDGTAKLWDLRALKVLDQLAFESVRSEGITSAAFSPDGKHVLLAPVDNGVVVWRFKAGKAQVQCNGGPFEMVSAAMSPDGTRLVSGSTEGKVIVWDFQLGETCVPLQILPHSPAGGGRDVDWTAYSPDSQRVLTAAPFFSPLAKVWDFDTQTVRTLRHDDGLDDVHDGVESAAFSADGDRVIIAAQRIAYVWNLQTGTVAKLVGHQKPVYFARISPDGTVAFTVSEDGTVKTWRL